MDVFSFRHNDIKNLVSEIGLLEYMSCLQRHKKITDINIKINHIVLDIAIIRGSNYTKVDFFLEKKMECADDSPVYGVDYDENNILDSINGSVYAAGYKFDIRAWLDIGSVDWKETTEEQRKGAYRAARKAGWSKKALMEIMLKKYTHLSDVTLEMTFEMLESSDVPTS